MAAAFASRQKGKLEERSPQLSGRGWYRRDAREATPAIVATPARVPTAIKAAPMGQSDAP